jgi:NodT family efflux transporter outer membrane factor (OMF) lipoprotein
MTAYRPLPNDTQHYRQVAEIPVQWWQVFGSTDLDTLVERAFAANPNLDAARAALRQAQENVAAQRGAFWPQASVELLPSRQKIAGNLTSPLNSGAGLYSLHTAQLTVAYAPDVFGGNRRAVESVAALADVQAFELEAARLSIASNVVMAAFQEASLRAQIAAAEKLAGLQTQMLNLAKRQFELGAIAKAGLVAQEAALAQTRALLPPLRKQLAQTRDLLTALVGDLPDKELAIRFELDRLELPQQLPLTLPAQLVAQRPDVCAAEAQVHAAAAQVGIAVANRLPQFAIGGSIGSVASRLPDLFKSGTGFWSLIGSIAQPIFQGGALAHRQAAAQAGFEQALAQYRATVIAAFQNVADTLYALDQDRDALESATAARDAAERAFAIARRQTELGDISHFALLSVEQIYLQALIVEVQAKTNRYADAAALFQALGGGW